MSQGKLGRDAGKMSAAVFLSRITGLVREQIFAHFFGAGLASDAFLVAFRIPNLFRDLFAEGAMSTAFVAVFAKTPPGEESRKLARSALTFLTLVLGALCAAMVVFAPEIVDLFARGFRASPAKFDLTVDLTRLLVPFLYFASAASLAMGVLNTLGFFFVPSLGSTMFNVSNVVVGGLLAMLVRPHYGQAGAIWGFAVGALLGGFLQWAVQWRLLLKNGFVPWAGFTAVFHPKRIAEAFAHSGLRRILMLMAPAVLGVSAAQINVLINTFFATSLEAGSVSWLNYAYRLMHFPMGVFGVALSTAALPQLSRFVGAGDWKSFDGTLNQAMRYSLILALGSTGGLLLLGQPLVALIYEHGHFGVVDTQKTSLVLDAYILGLTAYSLHKICFSAFFAIGKVWLPTLVSVLGVAFNFGANYYLSKEFRVVGVAGATSITLTLNMLAMALLLRAQGRSFWTKESTHTLVMAGGGAAALVAARVLGVTDWIMLQHYSRGALSSVGIFVAAFVVFGGFYAGWICLTTTDGRVLFENIWRKLYKRRHVSRT